MAGEWISVPEAARVKGVSQSSVRLAIRAGRLPGARVGRNYILRRQDVEGWLLEPRGPKRAHSEDAQRQVVSLPALPLVAPEEIPQPTRDQILAFLEATPQEQERLLRQTARPGRENPFQKALRLKAAVSHFAHRGVSTTEYFQEKRAEIALEQRRADARDA